MTHNGEGGGAYMLISLRVSSLKTEFGKFDIAVYIKYCHTNLILIWISHDCCSVNILENKHLQNGYKTDQLHYYAVSRKQCISLVVSNVSL